MRDAAAALAGGFLQPDLPKRQALGLCEVKGPDVQAFQPGQDCHQFFSGYQPTTDGVSEVALRIKGYKMSTMLQLLKKSSFKEGHGTEKGKNSHGRDLSTASWCGVGTLVSKTQQCGVIESRRVDTGWVGKRILSIKKGM